MALAVVEQFRVVAQKTEEATQRLLVRTAKENHARIMATDPRPRRFRRFVDGRLGAREEAVRPTGIIVYQYPRLAEVAQFALETLYDFSPVRSGRYRQAHTLYVAGVPVADLSGLQDGQEVMIANPLPYARKIELGGMKMRLPGTAMVYDRAADVVSRRYGNAARVLFVWRTLPNARGVKDRSPAIILRER